VVQFKQQLRLGFTSAAAVSAILCVATGWLWMRSYGIADSLSWVRSHQRLSLDSDLGRVGLTWDGTQNDSYPAFNYGHKWSGYAGTYQGDPFVNKDWRVAGFQWLATQGGETSPGPVPPGGFPLIGNHFDPGWRVVAPHWFLVAVAALLPVRWWQFRKRSFRKARLASAGLCSACGYDLRVTPERCPECGLAASQVPPTRLTSKPTSN